MARPCIDLMRGAATSFGRRLAAYGAAAAALGYSNETLATCESAAEAKAPNVLGAVILFRHGARSAIFQLPESVGESPPYNTVNGPPAHAHPSKVVNGKACHRFMPPGSPGYLTELGWQQGESLGRRLRKRYGQNATIEAVKTTDTSRTMLTAHAVLTGFFDPSLASGAASAPMPAVIDVVRGPALAVDIGCSELALSMGAGRASHRTHDAKNNEARAALAAAFGASSTEGSTGLLAALDDCLARRAHGHPPSFSIDPALCDVATREAAREVRAALRHDGFRAAKLAAGRLCHLIATHVRDVQRASLTPPAAPPAPAPVSTSPAPVPALSATATGPRLLLLSGHDTSIMGLITALSWPRSPSTTSKHFGHRTSSTNNKSSSSTAGASGSTSVGGVGGTETGGGSGVAAETGLLLADGVWPPHCACIAVELLDTGAVRILYQFEALFEQPASDFLGDMQSLASTDQAHEKLCRGSAGGDGAVFNWAD